MLNVECLSFSYPCGREILRDIPGLHQTSSAGTGIEQTFQARASALRYAIPIRLY